MSNGKSWIVTLGSFAMLFITIIGESFGLDVSPEGIAAAQNIAITSAGAGAAVSVAKRVPDMKIPRLHKPTSPSTPKYSKNTAWSITNQRQELKYGSPLWVRSLQKADAITARVERVGDGKLVSVAQTTGDTDVQISMTINNIPVNRTDYRLTVTIQNGASITQCPADTFAVV